MKNNLGVILPIQTLTFNQTFEQWQIHFDSFLGFCQKEKINYWQLLPIHQREQLTNNKLNPSPYQSFGIGFDEKILPHDYPFFPQKEELEKFYQQWAFYLRSYLLFKCLTFQQKTDNWLMWTKDLKDNNYLIINLIYQKKLKKLFNFYLMKEWQLHHFFTHLIKKTTENKIKVIADLPFYPSLKSSLVWQNQKSFFIELKRKKLQLVSGVASKIDNTFGQQIWGHPLYKFYNSNSVIKIKNIFHQRLHFLTHFFDGVRFDHANGFWQYSQINVENNQESIHEGLGTKFLQNLVDQIKKQKKEVFLETITTNNKNINQEMNIFFIKNKILQPHIFVHQPQGLDKLNGNDLLFSSTHDTPTIREFIHSLSCRKLQNFCYQNNLYFAFNRKKIYYQLMIKLKKSSAKIKIFSWQDYFYQDIRWNIPGTIDSKNWAFETLTKKTHQLFTNHE